MSLIIPANTLAASGYAVDNSCRFNGTNDSLNLTTGTPTDAKKFTFSTWLKKCKNGVEQDLMAYNPSGNAESMIRIDDSDRFVINDRDASDTDVEFFLVSNAVLRDPSAWYNLIVAVDTTDGTNTNRVKMYINGTQVTSLQTATYPDQNITPEISAGSRAVYVGARVTSQFFNGYLAETVFIDGQQLAADQFGEFDEDSGIWKPIDVSGLTAGTNGFYLDFEASGNLGNDVFGGTDLTENNLTAIDQSTDTCTNNFATMNPLSSGMTLTEGNLNVAGPYNAVSTFSVANGKWYVEMKATNAQTYNPVVGIATDNSTDVTNPASDSHPGNFSESHGYDRSGVIKSNDNTAVQSSLTTSQSDGDIIGLAVDLDSGTKTAQWYVNGSSVGSAVTLVSDESYVFITYASGSQAGTGAWNFGSPSYSESGGETDGNGYGNFAHAVPSGYYSLNTKNLAEYG